MVEGINIDQNILAQVLQNTVAQQAVHIAQLEAAIQQLSMQVPDNVPEAVEEAEVESSAN